MTDPRTPPRHSRRHGSSNTIPLHIPTTPSRLRETTASSPENSRTEDVNEQSAEVQTRPRLLSAFGPHDHSTTRPETSREGEDDQAQGTIVEPSGQEESERTALLEHYHNQRICGLRNCNHGTFSPRAASFMSTTNESFAESSGLRSPHISGYAGEHDRPKDFAHAFFGDPIADALMGTKKKRSNTKHLTMKYGLRNTRLMYAAYYFPSVRWITQYKWSWFRGDLVAAITMASFYIPMSLSYASNLGHIPALNGLYSFVVHPLAYALLGSCPQMAVGPEAPGSLLVGTVIATCIKNGHAGDSDASLHAEIAGVVTATAGAILFVAGLTRLGFLDSILSRPFLRGFISAIGIVIFVDQAIPELGLSPYVNEAGVEHESSAKKFVFLIQYIQHSHKLTAAVAFGTFAITMVLRELKIRLQPRYPGAAYFPDRFLVVVISTILAWKLDWAAQGLENLGHVKPPGDSIFKFHWPYQFRHMQHIDTALSTSLIISLLGFFESSVAAKSLGDGTSALKGVNVSANRELIALGTANLIGGCFGSLPAFGGYGRSKVNVSTGGTTPMSSALLSLFSLLSVFFLLPAFSYIPKCVLSSMISVVAWSLVEEAPHDVKFFIKIRGWSELALMAIIFLSTIFYSLTVGIALGMGLSLLQIIRHATKPRIQIIGRVPGVPNRFEHAESQADNIEHIDGCLIVKIPEPLTFANTGALKNRLRRLEKYGTDHVHPSLPRVRDVESNKNIVFDIHGVTSIDGSGVQVFAEIVEGYVKRGVRVVFCRLPRKRSKLLESFERSGIVDLIGGRRHFVESIEEALKLAEAEDEEHYFSTRPSS